MGKPTTQNNNFINHFSHPHRLQLIPATSSPPCSACKIAGCNNRIYSCRPCNFSLHESCSKMKQVITHPSHPSHTLTLLVAPVYDGGYFNCDGCGVIGTGFSYQCSGCDFDIHALCAYKPLSIIHKSHPQHSLKLAFHSPYGANKGFSCDVCLKIGKNQWLYRCVPCEFDAHVGCITASQPHQLQHSNSAPTPHAHHTGHPQHQTSLPMPNQGSHMPRPRPMTRPNGPIRNPTRPMAQNVAAYGPRRQNNNNNNNNNLGYNVQVVPSGPNGHIEQVGQSFDQGSTDGSGYDGSVGNEEFDGEVDVEIEYEVDVYEANEDGEANEEGQDIGASRLEIVSCGDDYDAPRSDSEFGGSSDARSQCNDSSDVDLYPLSVRTNKGSGGGRKKTPNPSGPGGLQGSKNPVQSPRGPQSRRMPNVRNTAVRAGGPVRVNIPREPAAFNGPQVLNGPIGGPSNAIDSSSNYDNYNLVDGGNMYGGDSGAYGESYGDGDCNYEVGSEFIDDGCDQAYDETYGENDFESYNESMHDGGESYGTMDDSQYGGVSDEPNNQYVPMVGPVGGPGINNQNQYCQTGRPRNVGRYGRGGTTNMNQGVYRTQPRTMGPMAQHRPNGGPYRTNMGFNGPNGLGNDMMNTMVRGLCQGLATNMLIGGGGDVMNGGASDGGGSFGDMFGGGSFGDMFGGGSF